MGEDANSSEYVWLQQPADVEISAGLAGQQTRGPFQPSHVSSVNQHTLHPVDAPIYVNARQYARILKRRQARILLESRRKTIARQQFLHESRHNHACKRPRGPQGRFLTKDELEQRKRVEENSSNDGDNNGNGSSTSVNEDTAAPSLPGREDEQPVPAESTSATAGTLNVISTVPELEI